MIHSETHPLYAAEQHLRACDAVITDLIEQYGQPCELADQPASYFHTLVKTVIDQQLSVQAAQRIAERLLSALGKDRFVATELLQMEVDALRACGLSRNKIRCVHALADAVVSGALDFEHLSTLPDRVVAEQLMLFPGIGPWTAEIFLMFAFNRLDLLPLGDLALRSSIQIHYQLATDAVEADYRAVAEAWRPYRSVASWYLWAAVD